MERDHEKGVNEVLWDFSLASSVNVTLILAIAIRLCQINFQSALRRNRLTFSKHQWAMFNQLVLQTKIIIEAIWVIADKDVGELFKYAITTLMTQIFVTVVLIQLQEWHIIAILVKFQSSMPGNLLDVKKEEFQIKEKRVAFLVKVAAIFIGLYNLTKLIVASSTLLFCGHCQLSKEYVLNVFLYCDICLMSLTFAYFLYVFTILIKQTYSRYRYEFNEHRSFFIVYGCSMLLSFPIVLTNMIYWQIAFQLFQSSRLAFYASFLSFSTPTAVIALAKPNEDCLDCFNRCSPWRYSSFQYSTNDLLNLRLSADEHQNIVRRSGSLQIQLHCNILRLSNRQSEGILSPQEDSDKGSSYAASTPKHSFSFRPMLTQSRQQSLMANHYMTQSMQDNFDPILEDDVRAGLARNSHFVGHHLHPVVETENSLVQ